TATRRWRGCTQVAASSTTAEPTHPPTDRTSIWRWPTDSDLRPSNRRSAHVRRAWKRGDNMDLSPGGIKPRHVGLALSLAVVLLAAACGGDNSKSSGATTTAPAGGQAATAASGQTTTAAGAVAA